MGGWEIFNACGGVGDLERKIVIKTVIGNQDDYEFASKNAGREIEREKKSAVGG